jgi:hypothetical protein
MPVRGDRNGRGIPRQAPSRSVGVEMAYKRSGRPNRRLAGARRTEHTTAAAWWLEAATIGCYTGGLFPSRGTARHRLATVVPANRAHVAGGMALRVTLDRPGNTIEGRALRPGLLDVLGRSLRRFQEEHGASRALPRLAVTAERRRGGATERRE